MLKERHQKCRVRGIFATLYRCATENEHDETISNDDETMRLPVRSSFDGVFIGIRRGMASRYSGIGRRDETQERV